MQYFSTYLDNLKPLHNIQNLIIPGLSREISRCLSRIGQRFWIELVNVQEHLHRAGFPERNGPVYRRQSILILVVSIVTVVNVDEQVTGSSPDVIEDALR